MTATRIYCVPIMKANGVQRSGHKRGPFYEARLGALDGELLVKSTAQPSLDGARVLLSRGMTGPVELWGDEPYPRLLGIIEEWAKWTVEESDKVSPRFKRWEPFENKAVRSRVGSPSAVSGVGGAMTHGEASVAVRADPEMVAGMAGSASAEA